MKLNKSIGMVLLSIWLILYGLRGLFNFNYRSLNYLVILLAIVAGVVILLFDRTTTGTGS